MLSLLVTVTVALVTGSGRGRSRRWGRSLLLSLLGAVAGDLVAGGGRCCSRCWEWLLVDFVGSDFRWLSSVAVVGGFRRKRSSVLSSVVIRQR